jgi:NAD(P)H dehydrogenase (quinone)
MIIVTGANGRLGSLVVDRLLARVDADQVGVSVRNVGEARSLAARGVRVRAGDFTDPTSLQHSFENAEQVLVVSAAIRGPGAADANRAAIRAAVRAGASRVLYTSHQAASVDSLFPAQHQHAATETFLAEQDVAWTALRHGFYVSTLEIYLPQALATGELRLPADGPFSWTAHADLAEADAIALTRTDAVDITTPTLTAAEALDFAEVARILGDVTGRAIRRVVISDEEWRSSAIDNGLPAPAADFTLGMFQAARRGEFAMTDPTLEELLGRHAISARASIEAIVATTR